MRRRVEIEIRKEMEEAAVRKEEVARENAEARKAQKVARDLAAELASREGKAAAEAAKNAAAQRERDAAKAVAAAEEEEKAAEVAKLRNVRFALAERADGQMKAGHAANKQGDYAKARPRLAPASHSFSRVLPSRSVCATSRPFAMSFGYNRLWPTLAPNVPAPLMVWPLAHGCALRHAANRASDPRKQQDMCTGAPLLLGGARAPEQARGASLGGQHGAQAARGVHRQAGVRAGLRTRPTPQAAHLLLFIDRFVPPTPAAPPRFQAPRSPQLP